MGFVSLDAARAASAGLTGGAGASGAGAGGAGDAGATAAAGAAGAAARPGTAAGWPWARAGVADDSESPAKMATPPTPATVRIISFLSSSGGRSLTASRARSDPL